MSRAIQSRVLQGVLLQAHSAKPKIETTVVTLTVSPRIGRLQVACHQMIVAQGKADSSGRITSFGRFLDPDQGAPQLPAVDPHIGRWRWTTGATARPPTGVCCRCRWRWRLLRLRLRRLRRRRGRRCISLALVCQGRERIPAGLRNRVRSLAHASGASDIFRRTRVGNAAAGPRAHAEVGEQARTYSRTDGQTDVRSYTRSLARSLARAHSRTHADARHTIA